MSPSNATPVEPATVAVTFDTRSVQPRIVQGLADRAAQRAITADDPVRIASISKLVTALGVMRLVDAGVLHLDRDVSAYLGWPFRHPAFPDSPITLRMLLSHQAGLLDGADEYVIPLGETLRDRLSAAHLWDAAQAPGSGGFHYANMNFPVIASVIEAATGKRFDRVMTARVFRPLMLDACFNWSGCSPRAIRRAVVLYRSTGEVARDDLRGRPPACIVVPAADGTCDLSGYRPGANGSLFSPQGGVRISARDLARIGQMLARRGKGFLKPRTFAEMTRNQWAGSGGLDEQGEPGGVFCAYGLGVHRIGTRGAGCSDDLFGDGVTRIGHSGEAYGLRSGLWLDPKSGRGLAFFTAQVPDDAPVGPSGFTRREEDVVSRVRLGGD
ncbi:MAG: serine hydrolase domain-containing protein [Novosphingobium sp.]|nr:serine hydrolase domain-containing protein [Novosphingobium sp.]